MPPTQAGSTHASVSHADIVDLVTVPSTARGPTPWSTWSTNTPIKEGTVSKPVLPNEDNKKMPPTQGSVPIEESVKPCPLPPVNVKKAPVKQPRRPLPEHQDTPDSKSPVKTQEQQDNTTSLPIPGNNVWKYLVELDKRRSAYKAKGK